MESVINIGIILTYIMIGFGAIIAIGFGIKKMLSNTQNTKKTLFTLGGLITILVISYLMASDEVVKSFEKYEITSSVSKQVGMGLVSFYILIFGAIAAVLYSEISNVFSK